LPADESGKPEGPALSWSQGQIFRYIDSQLHIAQSVHSSTTPFMAYQTDIVTVNRYRRM